MNTKLMIQLTLVLGMISISSNHALAAESRAQSCKNYAATAVIQQTRNVMAKCNYKGLRWSDDQKGQNKWCMTARPKITQAETDARQLLLNTCYAEKADAENNKEPIKLPGACRWNRERYKQVRYIFSRNSYNDDPIPVSPIKGGLIAEDLNKDRKPDYIYLERSPDHQFRMIMCLSSPSGWKRQQLTKIAEDVGPGTGAGFDDMSASNGKVTLVRNSTQHNTGSTSVIRSYIYSTQEKALLLESEVSEFISADLFTSSTKTTTDYVKGVVRHTVKCADFEDACNDEDKTTRLRKSAFTTDKRKLEIGSSIHPPRPPIHSPK